MQLVCSDGNLGVPVLCLQDGLGGEYEPQSWYSHVPPGGKPDLAGRGPADSSTMTTRMGHYSM